ncbi:SGNH/GDSL hydrolase family protein [Falsibacillus albus]|uniref:SGNH/GDSL hydrolase family protein n=1 Tax=Falsibacillus albus TaxID=2478915 RepID=A0A3L7JVB5_9BACI|nr:SGNH/GDSL hydrolase family protein [Falsibacillus albus]RLQ94797.1 SGNH/GDSL hydrolase family protein [Falsibacillus albus]
MRLKILLISVLLIIFVGVLALGTLHWNESVAAAGSENDDDRTTPSLPDDSPNKFELSEQEKRAIMLAKNWSLKAQEALKSKMKSNQPFLMGIVGSQSLGKDVNGWSVQLKTKMEQAFGSDVLQVKIFEYDSIRSSKFIKYSDYQEVADFKPDMVLFEPFTLNDNGYVPVESEEKNFEKFQAALGDAVMILQPPHPIYQSTYYPRQVAAIKKFAESKSITYLDHWTAWPDPATAAVKEDLTPSQSAPNEKGHKLWAEYLEKYFIAE